MKKSLVLMAMAGVALASCVNDEVVDVPQKEQEKVKITFDKPVAYGKTNSRVGYVGEVGTHKYTEAINGTIYSYPQEESFTIYAVWDEKNNQFDGWPEDGDPTFANFNKNEISYEPFVDGWAPKTNDKGYYTWNDDKVLSYAAISPSNLTDFPNKISGHPNGVKDGEPIAYNEGVAVTYGNYKVEENGVEKQYMGTQIKNFEIPKNPAFHYEVLYSKLFKNSTSSNMNHDPGKYSGLPVTFQRALSEIRFSIKTDIEDENVYLHEIILWGAKLGKADFAENISIPSGTEGENLWSSWQYVATPKWTFHAAPNKLTENDDFVIYRKASDNVGAKFENEAKYVKDKMGDKDILNHVFFIPQNFSEESDDIKIKVTYQIGSSQNNKPITKSYSLKGLQLSDSKGAPTGDPINEWKQGERYTYRLYLSTTGAKKDKIIFSPESSVWKEISGIVVYL